MGHAADVVAEVEMGAFALMSFRVTWEGVDSHKRKDAERMTAHLNEQEREGWRLVNAATAPMGSGTMLHSMFWVKDRARVPLRTIG